MVEIMEQRNNDGRGEKDGGMGGRGREGGRVSFHGEKMTDRFTLKRQTRQLSYSPIHGFQSRQGNMQVIGAAILTGNFKVCRASSNT